ncbi:hypothetical protein ASG40_02695 [Methylobacterium sp. Leaf399]|nr:hypothetical protein ASF39_02685 [Methylobacterium sp. Leaf108]KQT19748.1 hypothetical protein ASG40_02695 [Methylobacterium sp. Leaf399]KQT80797.1 hypothetical protein ASG59_05120 [Methylobacterium sp. Leaf466]
MSTIAGSSLSDKRPRRRRLGQRGLGRLLAPWGGAIAILVLATPARADLRLCNQTTSKVGISLGYRDAQGWVTEGWWDLTPKACETLLRGSLSARFYYVFAVDYTRGGEWSGRSLMCTKDSEFTIRGVEDCLARGFDRNGFYEVDTGEQKSWTIQLSDPNQPAGGAPP